jgi:hypothetical protein
VADLLFRLAGATIGLALRLEILVSGQVEVVPLSV